MEPMSARATAAPSASHTAVANTSVRGVQPDIVDHEVIMAGSKKRSLVFVRDDDSGLPPVGVGGIKAPPLTPQTEDGGSERPELADEGGWESQSIHPVAIDVPTPAIAPPPVAPPFPPPPRFKVEFVSDIVDLVVPCHEMSWVPESGMLSLVVPAEVKLKLSIDRAVTIRCPKEMGALSGERVYWFTGIAIPVRIVKAVVLVFGLQLDNDRT